jgi:hypothetical protein
MISTTLTHDGKELVTVTGTILGEEHTLSFGGYSLDACRLEFEKLHAEKYKEVFIEQGFEGYHNGGGNWTMTKTGPDGKLFAMVSDDEDCHLSFKSRKVMIGIYPDYEMQPENMKFFVSCDLGDAVKTTDQLLKE